MLCKVLTIPFVCDRQMMKDPETIPLLLSLCKLDYSSQMTAVKVLAELAEEPLNRVPLVSTTAKLTALRARAFLSTVRNLNFLPRSLKMNCQTFKL